MVDAAAHLGVAWQPTVGHWTDGEGDPDPWGSRRIDLILVSRPLAPALIAYGTNRSAAASRAADHLPIYTDLDPDLISREFANSEGTTEQNSGGVGARSRA
ncbi:hypothetical protein OIU91_02380 [Streptomyces sp. NBC_01456]|uniref:hypothetical protein n=1 Tax=unclassified Streptomyces TaxID=2593676 RepID=UPI002E33AC5B|nr:MULTISPECIES: hypothetical protein [unclassified Streptomyces]